MGSLLDVAPDVGIDQQEDQPLTVASRHLAQGLASLRRSSRRPRRDCDIRHRALTALEQHIPEFTLVTQNIDSLHQRAGSRRVIELHGNINRTKCFEENVIVESWEESSEAPPHCPRCGGRLRPDVVWFGENLPEQAFQEAVEAAVYADVFFAIGTSGTVEPAASLARVAQRFGATVVILNLDVEPLEAPPLYHIHGNAGSILPALVQATWP